MLRIMVLTLLLSVVISCYPPSYYDYWNVPTRERYMAWLDSYDYYYPHIYFNPYYYPYPYFPFSFSFYYSYNRYHFDHLHHGHYYPGWRHR